MSFADQLALARALGLVDDEPNADPIAASPGSSDPGLPAPPDGDGGAREPVVEPNPGAEHNDFIAGLIGARQAS